MAKKTKRSVGRPRASKRPVVNSASEDILLASARLFRKNGFAGTTTRQIAAEVGIRQPSVFSHFKKKEDILHTLIEKSAGIWLEFVDKLRLEPGRGADKLYALMRFDFLQLLTEPYGVGALMLLPELRSGKFKAEAAQNRERIIDLYRQLIRQGEKEGDFTIADPVVATNTVFGMGEAIWSWYTAKISVAPEQIAEQIADMAMKSLLAKPPILKGVKSRYEASLSEPEHVSIDSPS